MREIRIIVACGTGIATSTHVSVKIREALEEHGLQVVITQCRVQEVAALVSPGDVVVATAQVPNVPPAQVVNGVPFLTGIGSDSVLAEIIRRVKGE